MDSGRRRERTKLIYHLRVFDAVSSELLGHVTDLTPEGMMLLGERELEPERAVEVRMTLPSNVMSGGSLSFKVRVKWSRPDIGGQFYHTGVEVTELSGAAASVIQKLIRDFYEEPADELPPDELEKYL